MVRVIKSRRLRWAGYVARMEEGRSAFKIFTVKPTGRPRLTWEDNIRMDLEEIVTGRLSQLRLLQIALLTCLQLKWYSILKPNIKIHFK